MILTAFLYCLAGCSPQEIRPLVHQTESAMPQAPPVITVHEKTFVSSEQVPPGIRHITEALAREITGNPHAISSVKFTSGSRPGPVPWLAGQDFLVKEIDLLKLSREANEQGTETFMLEMKMNFRCPLQRTASLVIRTGYEPRPDQLTITSSSVQTVEPFFPEMQAFMVEEERFKGINPSQMDFPAFYSWVVSRAVSLTPSDEDRKIRLRLDRISVYERLSSLPHDLRSNYRVIIFAMERMHPRAGFKVSASGTPDGHNWADRIEYLDFDGWRTGMISLSIVLDWEVYYISALYSPYENLYPQQYPWVRTGLFTTEKNYRDWPAFDSETAAQGPLARCGFLLNPRVPHDARTIQARLKELGLALEITGAWDERSVKALKIFQLQKNLPPTGTWDQDTQKELFRDTGL